LVPYSDGLYAVRIFQLIFKKRFPIFKICSYLCASFKRKNMHNLIKEVQEEHLNKEVPDFKGGDTVTVHYRIREGNKERIQPFQGVVLQVRGSDTTKTFTVRKISDGIGVERIFPLFSPNIEKIVVNKRGAVRRSRIFYLRGLQGKKSRIKEKRV